MGKMILGSVVLFSSLPLLVLANISFSWLTGLAALLLLVAGALMGASIYEQEVGRE